MRTTVRLNEELLARVKEYAARHNLTMTSVLEDALRQLLDRQESKSTRPHVALITYGTGGFVVGLDPHDDVPWKRVIEDEDIAKFQKILAENRPNASA